MRTIEYINYVGQSEGTYNHPHYQSILQNPPYSYSFKSARSTNEDYNNFLEDLRTRCAIYNLPFEHVENFIRKIHTGAKLCGFRTKLGLAPTLPYIGPCNGLLMLEDWSDIFTFLMGTHTCNISFNEPYFDIMRLYMEMPQFKGIITHIYDTVKNLSTIFKGKIDSKIFYVPIGMKSPIIKKQRTDKLKILITNSYGAPINNFYVRGGVEAVNAVLSLINEEKPIDLTIVGPTPTHLISAATGKAKIYNGFIDDNLFSSILKEIDIFLIPAMRVHSISIVRAMQYGIIPIVSDGWGFDEFVKDKETGLVVRGQWGYTTWHNNMGIFVENYDNLPDSVRLIGDIKDSINYLLDTPIAVKGLSQNAFDFANKTWNITDRNCKLKEIFDYAYPL